MKKTLLFAIIALTTNGFAQINQPAAQMYNSRFNPLEIAMGRINATQQYDSENNVGQKAKIEVMKQGSSNRVVDSIYSWKWNGNIEWILSHKFADRTYDANNNITSETFQQWNGNSWMKSSQFTYTYDANNNLISTIFLQWNGSNWVKQYQTDMTYDANNNRLNYVSKYVDNGVLVSYFQMVNTYDANNNETSEFSQNWNGSEWVNVSNKISIYDEQNNCINEIYQDGDSSLWVNVWKYTFSYDANKKQTASLAQNWYGSEWVDNSRYTFSYDANNLISWLEQNRIGSEWINSGYGIYSYDGYHNRIASLSQQWDGYDWINTYQNTSSFDENNQLTRTTDQKWMGTVWETNFQGTFTYYDANNSESRVNKYFLNGSVDYGDSTYNYSHIVVTGIPNMDKSGISVYPNPGNGKFTLSSNDAISEVEIYNTSGKLVYTNYSFTKHGSKSIDLSSLSRGIYYVKVNTGNKANTTKIVIQ